MTSAGRPSNGSDRLGRTPGWTVDGGVAWTTQRQAVVLNPCSGLDTQRWKVDCGSPSGVPGLAGAGGGIGADPPPTNPEICPLLE